MLAAPPLAAVENRLVVVDHIALEARTRLSGLRRTLEHVDELPSRRPIIFHAMDEEAERLSAALETVGHDAPEPARISLERGQAEEQSRAVQRLALPALERLDDPRELSWHSLQAFDRRSISKLA
jgi:hypothetical protein